jgi:hypothetical protein
VLEPEECLLDDDTAADKANNALDTMVVKVSEEDLPLPERRVASILTRKEHIAC